MERPVLLGSIFFIIGILLARFTATSLALWLMLDAVSFFMAVFCFLYKNNALNGAASFFLISCLILTGAFWYSLGRYPEGFYQEYEGMVVNGEGIVSSYPNTNEYGMTCLIKVERIMLQNKNLRNIQRVLLKTGKEMEQSLFPGDKIIFRGEICRAPESRNPGQFNYREYLANQEIFYQVNCKNGEVKLAEKGQGIKTLAAKGRMRIVRHITNLLPPRERGLILGVLFGDTKMIEEEEWEAYKRAGVVHLFAVSGLHIGIVLGIIWFLLSFFQPKPLLRLMIGGIVIIGYGFMVGWSSSILRASLMALLGLLALTVGRKNDIYNSMGTAAWIILLLYPGELFQVGFQLSFLTTAGIVYLTPWLAKQGCGKWLSPTLAAQLVSAPLSAYHFNQISLIAPLANIFAVALSGIATMLTFIAACLCLFLPLIATPFFLVAGSIMFIVSEVIIWCAKLEWAGMIVASPSPSLLVCIYVLILVLPVLSRYRYIIREIPQKIKIVVACLLTVTILFTCWPTPKAMEVVFLDVGQGDSIFVRTPGGRTVLVDGGGTPGSSYSVGKKIVRPFLYHYGVHKIDYMVMSHNHVDHSEGLLEILPFFKVGAFFMATGEENNAMEQNISALCRAKKIPVRELLAGQKFQLEKDVFLEVLHPAKEDMATGNNHSLVLKLSYRDSSWLLTGDVEKEALAELLQQEANLQAAVLKIPHHGSQTSLVPEFYQQVQPRAVVISVGENRFGQPHPEVKEYFCKRGVPVYLTKERGAVITRSDGQKIIITTQLPSD